MSLHVFLIMSVAIMSAATMMAMTMRMMMRVKLWAAGKSKKR